jgi:MYXO-CTERM domain-containing protein
LGFLDQLPRPQWRAKEVVQNPINSLQGRSAGGGMALRAVLVALAATAILLMPAASAHTAIFSADDKVRGSIGLLNEPVSTYTVTGLDVCFTQNTASSPRPAVNVGNAGAFTAKLTAPDGAVHEADLEIPFGRPNCLTFADPLVLTKPGQYTVDLAGAINGTTFDAKGILAGGAVIDRGNITFPHTGVLSDVQLAERIAALETRIATLEQDLAAAEADRDDASEFAPGAPAALLLVGLAALAALRRRA